MLRPSFEDFVRLAAAGDLVPVARELLVDADTAVTAYHEPTRGAAPGSPARSTHGGSSAGSAQIGSVTAEPAPRFGFLLESVEGGEKWARYTFPGTAPREAWRLEAGGRVSRWTPGVGWGE